MYVKIVADVISNRVEILSHAHKQASYGIDYQVDIAPVGSHEVTNRSQELWLTVRYGESKTRTLEWSYAELSHRLSATDHQLIFADHIIGEPNDLITFNAQIVTRTGKLKCQSVLHMLVPIPEQPYDSWLFDGKIWRAPVPKPDSIPDDPDSWWNWDEASQRWIAVGIEF